MSERVITARNALDAHLASGTTAQLAAALMVLDSIQNPSEAQKRARIEVIEELTRRHADTVAPAVLAWHDDPESDATQAEVVIAALPAEALR